MVTLIFSERKSTRFLDMESFQIEFVILTDRICYILIKMNLFYFKRSVFFL